MSIHCFLFYYYYQEYMCASVSCYIIVNLFKLHIYLVELYKNVCLYFNTIHRICFLKFVNFVLKTICR